MESTLQKPATLEQAVELGLRKEEFEMIVAKKLIKLIKCPCVLRKI